MDESRSFLFDPSLSLSLFDSSSSRRVIFPLRRIDNTRLQHTWNTKLLLLVVDTRRPALRNIASLILLSLLPSRANYLLPTRNTLVTWPYNNNNAGNVSSKNRWGIRENALRDFRGELDLWTERGPCFVCSALFWGHGKIGRTKKRARRERKNDTSWRVSTSRCISLLDYTDWRV